MSDDGTTAVEEVKKKRGRQAKVDKSPVKDTKKRGRAAEKPAANHKSKSDGEEDGPPGPVKRGRGRPKGTHKATTKKAKKTTKSSSAGGRGRGRPKKAEDKPESTGDDEDQEEDN